MKGIKVEKEDYGAGDGATSSQPRTTLRANSNLFCIELFFESKGG